MSDQFDILFRISPDEWNVAQQASWQYVPEDERNNFPNWRAIPKGTITFVPHQDGNNSDLIRDSAANLFAHAPDLRRGVDGFPLGFGNWLATDFTELHPDYHGEWTYSTPAIDSWMQFVITPKDVALTSVSSKRPVWFDRMSFEASVRRSLTTLTQAIIRRAPGMLLVPDFAPLRPYAPAGLDLDALDDLPRDDRPGVVPQLTPVTFPMERAKPGDPIAWSLTDDRWDQLTTLRRHVDVGSADDLLSILFQHADGWIGLAGQCHRVVAADYAANNQPEDHWEVLGYEASTPETTRFVRGHRVSVLAFAEFLGWLLEAADFLQDRYPSAHDYVDPIHPLRMRFVNRDLETISIQTNQFADRGYRLELPIAEFADLADAFRASVATAIRERAPELGQLVSARYIMGAER